MTDDMFDGEQPDGREGTPYVDLYGLSDIKYVECRNKDGVVVQQEVTNAHRYEALALTSSETLQCFDDGLRQVAPGLRRYGQTLAAIVRKFQEERGVIREEMARIAVKNLTAVVAQKPGTRRILNLEIAVAVKRKRDGVEEEVPPEETSSIVDNDPTSLLND